MEGLGADVPGCCTAGADWTVAMLEFNGMNCVEDLWLSYAHIQEPALRIRLDLLDCAKMRSAMKIDQ
jgi:hypothetical protein